MYMFRLSNVSSFSNTHKNMNTRNSDSTETVPVPFSLHSDNWQSELPLSPEGHVPFTNALDDCGD